MRDTEKCCNTWWGDVFDSLRLRTFPLGVAGLNLEVVGRVRGQIVYQGGQARTGYPEIDIGLNAGIKMVYSSLT